MGDKMIRLGVVEGIIVSLLGILLVINGRIILSFIDPAYQMETNFENYKTSSPIMMTIMGFALSFYTIVWAYGIVITKKVKANVI